MESLRHLLEMEKTKKMKVGAVAVEKAGLREMFHLNPRRKKIPRLRIRLQNLLLLLQKHARA